MALTLTRRLNESLDIGDGTIIITVTRIGCSQVRLSIEASKDIPIVRSELLARGNSEKDREDIGGKSNRESNK